MSFCHLGTVQHCLSVVKRVWSFTDCILVTMNNDDDGRYFIANEWNEIQSMRKISPAFQYFAAILFLSVIGIGNVGTMDPSNELSLSNVDHYYAPVSNVLRFALIASIYLLIGMYRIWWRIIHNFHFLFNIITRDLYCAAKCRSKLRCAGGLCV